MSSSFGLDGGALDGATHALASGAGPLAWLEQLRCPMTATMPRTSTTATIAYFALPPETGTPAGGRLEGGLISWEDSIGRRPRVYVRARRAEYSGFVECKGRVAVSARFAAKEASYIGGRGAPCVLEHHPSSIRHRAGEGEVGERFRGYTGVDHGPGRIGEHQVERPFDRNPAHDARDVALDPASDSTASERLDIRSEHLDGLGRTLDEQGSLGAPRESFDCERTRSCVQIEHASPREDPRRRKNPEERLPDTIRRRPGRAPARRMQCPRPIDPAGDTHGTLREWVRDRTGLGYEWICLGSEASE